VQLANFFNYDLNGESTSANRMVRQSLIARRSPHLLRLLGALAVPFILLVSGTEGELHGSDNSRELNGPAFTTDFAANATPPLSLAQVDQVVAGTYLEAQSNFSAPTANWPVASTVEANIWSMYVALNGTTAFNNLLSTYDNFTFTMNFEKQSGITNVTYGVYWLTQSSPPSPGGQATPAASQTVLNLEYWIGTISTSSISGPFTNQTPPTFRHPNSGCPTCGKGGGGNSPAIPGWYSPEYGGYELCYPACNTNSNSGNQNVTANIVDTLVPQFGWPNSPPMNVPSGYVVNMGSTVWGGVCSDDTCDSVIQNGAQWSGPQSGINPLIWYEFWPQQHYSLPYANYWPYQNPPWTLEDSEIYVGDIHSCFFGCNWWEDWNLAIWDTQTGYGTTATVLAPVTFQAYWALGTLETETLTVTTSTGNSYSAIQQLGSFADVTVSWAGYQTQLHTWIPPATLVINGDYLVNQLVQDAAWQNGQPGCGSWAPPWSAISYHSGGPIPWGTTQWYSSQYNWNCVI
jgi:hypothetical protein